MIFSSSSAAVFLGAIVFCVFLYNNLIRPLFLTPLSRIPSAHPLAHITGLWILWIRFRSQENRTIDSAHKAFGPVIKLSPNEISINCVNGGIKTVYAGGFEKHEWYPNLFYNFGQPNMFSMAGTKQHSARKRMIMAIYSKSSISTSPAMRSMSVALIYQRFLPLLRHHAESGKYINIYAAFSAITMDFVTGYLFGLDSSSNLTQNMKKRDHFLDLYHSRRSYNYWPQELPGLTEFFKSLGIRLVPKWVDAANAEIEAWTLEMCDQAARHSHSDDKDPGSSPVVYSQLSATKHANPLSRLEIASELLDHLAAGFDTSGITLTYAVHQLSQHPRWQNALRAELRTLDTPVSIRSHPYEASLPSSKALDTLPTLQAILQETLRLHAAIPGPQPRITPPGGCRIGTDECHYQVPGGVRISAQAYSLHRNAAVFEEPETWRPERWLEASPEKLREMMRWYWPFSSGGRMCIGSHLAMYQMQNILAAVYTDFMTEIVDDADIEQLDIYTAPPKSDKLIMKLAFADT
ncbi:cytochrome P450 [Trichodelitschia bisporula]|uniref:Cytochrome P450 n=1 Tax=Trichodelitschia bisporula TaxID=703511 RepID=A0A6G1HY45_9PEZI|nr:cytochrome P450 [Trichodelitschia bisporula]